MLDEANWPEIGTPNFMGCATISKLLAAKRPRLLPVLDSVVCKTLGGDKIRKECTFWRAFRYALAFEDDRLVRAAESLLQDDLSAVHGDLSVLRCIDIVVWMQGR